MYLGEAQSAQIGGAIHALLAAPPPGLRSLQHPAGGRALIALAIGMIFVSQVFSTPLRGQQPAESAPPTLRLERSVTGQTLTSVADPRIRIQLDKSFRYAGGQRFVLRGTADAEQHFFVQADDRKIIQGMYWIQFERFLPGRSGQYSYESDKTVLLDGVELRAHIRRFVEQPAPQSDRRHAYEYLEQAGYAVPTPATRARLVLLPEKSRRQEVMIIYLEQAPSAADVTSEEAAAVLRRAVAGLSLDFEAPSSRQVH